MIWTARNSAGSSEATVTVARSEEHTSELQSQSNIVCRLLLDKNIKRVIDGRKVVVLDVGEFEDTIIICNKTVNSTDVKPRVILRESAIYVRTPAASTEKRSSP